MDRKGIMTAIFDERRRQIMVEGYTADHDDKWTKGELAVAAGVYAQPENMRHIIDWPFGEKKYHPLPLNRQKELIKAAALIVAEIERLNRHQS